MARLSEAQLRERVRRCEHAMTKRCHCCCGGALHGQHHDELWIRAQLLNGDSIYTRRTRGAPDVTQLELFT